MLLKDREIHVISRSFFFSNFQQFYGSVLSGNFSCASQLVCGLASLLGLLQSTTQAMLIGIFLDTSTKS